MIDECGNSQDPEHQFILNICPSKAFEGTVIVHVNDDDTGDVYDILNSDIELSVTGEDAEDCDGGGGGGGGENEPPVVTVPGADVSDDEGQTLSTNGAFEDPDGDESRPRNHRRQPSGHLHR